MYLKKIMASGFKSFADKIIIDLTDGITGIVGPNGSGKSNVVDAVRWVLGEQSIKSLRGDGAMTDVIFSGSKSRGAMNNASVTLVFDNSDHYLNVAYDEVAIRRRVYKDGTNEYSINGEKCRLKDISEILMDTGVAKESFNIISQGKIEEIISSKASDRRVIFEEAAGVLKYKKRKEDALNKLARTHENMSRVEDIIKELEERVNPLKEQREKAILYQEKMSELENIEVALIAHDIKEINTKYQDDKSRIEALNIEIESLSTTSSSNETKVLSSKVEISKLEEKIKSLQLDLIEKNKEAEKINSDKNLLIERQKFMTTDSKIHNELIDLKENKLKIESEINNLNLELNNNDSLINKSRKDVSSYESDVSKLKNERNKLDLELTSLVRTKSNLEHQVEHIKDSIDNNSILPYAVRSVLDNPKLSGIYNTIGNVVNVDDNYMVAISVALGFGTSYVIVENEESAKSAIKYLKDNNIGRVTFFPLSVIKSKNIDSDTFSLISKETGFINVASNLVKYDKIYQSIIENQLGNIIVVDNIDNANRLSKKINHRYRIVTLSGEMLHVGGSITGGNVANNKSVITEKYELEESIKKLNNTLDSIKDIENKINDIDNSFRPIEDKLYLAHKELINYEELGNIKTNELRELKGKLEKLSSNISSLDNIKNDSVTKEEEKLLNDYYKKIDEINKIKNELDNLTYTKDSLKEDLEQREFTIKKENSIYSSKSKELKDLEIELNRMDVKLDNLLNKLSESYSMTYEHASKYYHLDIEVNDARLKTETLKRSLKELGNVNLDSIEEYETVSKRYEFLLNQKEDLTNASNTLLSIIEEMDTVMTREFASTFKLIEENFSTTFKELFKGGNASLKLTDPDNLLETGIEIVASPPGKKLTSISLLSGGEKTFTAISLLFAILKSRPVPFCILDEVEAALDEVNVDSFGKYLKNLQAKTQFILITHKKRTMEYADILYGITMQESGVSKLVSVKLENI